MIGKDDILACLALIDEGLWEAKAMGEITLSGDAALCLVHGAMDEVREVDAVFEPHGIICGIAVNIALAMDLPFDWLNDSVRYAVLPNAPTEPFMHMGNLRVSAFSAEYLLVMRMMFMGERAANVGELGFLLGKSGIASVDEAQALLLRYHDATMIPPGVLGMVGEILGGIRPNNPQ
ncbi:MAG: hypothetical protein LBF40_06710 [Deltaproteobacteria bacterium]|jgi:hypothetical protein|nr:hypothetical protein [Deltaproteobacteria bacterium]